jgi:hypothetical protein
MKRPKVTFKNNDLALPLTDEPDSRFMGKIRPLAASFRYYSN